MRRSKITSIGTGETMPDLLRAARRERGLSQYALADALAQATGNPATNRDLVYRWEQGQIPRPETRRWLSVVLQVPHDRVEKAAALTRRRARLGAAKVVHDEPGSPPVIRVPQGSPALLPVLRSRVQAGILAATLLKPERWFSLSELANRAGSSIAAAGKEVERLEAAGIVTTRREGTMRLFRAGESTPTLAPLSDLIRMTYGVPQIVSEEFSQIRGLTRILLAGAWAQRFAGIPGPPPDAIDILLLPDHSLDGRALDAAKRRVQWRIGQPVRCLTATPGAQPTTAPLFRFDGNEHSGVVVEVARDRATTTLFPGPDEVRPIRATVARLLEAGQLELVSGPAASGQPFLNQAAQTLASAERISDTSPDSAFILLAHTAHLIGMGLLAQQGLRPGTGAASHILGDAVTAQFGYEFSHIERLRQRTRLQDLRDRQTIQEAGEYIRTLRSLLSAARQIVNRITLFVA